MTLKKIVLIGASNSMLFNGLRAGLRQDGIELTNLALGGSSALFSLYCVLRGKYQNEIKQADLIILESNIIDVVHGTDKNNDVNLVIRNIFFAYNELSKLNKKFLVLLLPLVEKDEWLNTSELINNAHRMCCNQYGFNCADIQALYLKNGVMHFFMNMVPDSRHHKAHQLQRIMCEFGKNIANENFSLFKYSIPSSINLDFKVCSPANDLKIGGDTKEFSVSDFFHNDKCYRILKGDKYTFPICYEGYNVIAIHAWTHGKKLKTWSQHEATNSSVIIQNELGKFVNVTSPHYNSFLAVYDNNMLIGKHTTISLSNLATNAVDYFDIVNIMLFKDEGKMQININEVKETTIKREYSFSHLFPDIVFIKEVLEEYTQDVVLRLQKNEELQILSQLDFVKKFSTAKQRIQEQLPYKLGQAMILSSKSFFGYLFLPCVLLSVFFLHKQKQKKTQRKEKLTLPPLETYPDYDEALKEKECFTYKLGLALIKASKTWYMGGGIKLYFDIRKLKGKFQK